MKTKQEALILIKPEAMMRLRWIIGQIKGTGGKIIWTKSVTLNYEILRIFYPNITVNSLLWHATMNHLNGQPVAVLIIEGEGIIARVSALVGQDVNPERCVNNTLRHILWREFDLTVEHLGNGLRYFRNFVHCSRDQKEAASQIVCVKDPKIMKFPLRIP